MVEEGFGVHKRELWGLWKCLEEKKCKNVIIILIIILNNKYQFDYNK